MLQDECSEMPKNWNRRFKHNRDKIKTGDIYELAEVVRNLAIREAEKGLSTGEKQMFTRAKKILASELMYALGMDEEQVEEHLYGLLLTDPAHGTATATARWPSPRTRPTATQMAVALIVAAGRGERLGSEPAQGARHALRPADARVERRLRCRRCRRSPRIIVALPRMRSTPRPTGTVAVAGGVPALALGARRAGGVRDGDPVIVHDAARPLARPQLFTQALLELGRHPEAAAVIAAAPVADTIKEVGGDGATVSRTLDRARLWAVQTPQVFRRAALERALAQASDDDLATATDDAWLVERSGGVVRILASDPGNLKITTAEDLRVAELLLSERLG